MSRKEMIRTLMLSPFYWTMTVVERRHLLNECMRIENVAKELGVVK